MAATNRRGFIKHGLVAAGGLGVGLAAWTKLARRGSPPGLHKALGPLVPINDQTTGLPILNLPEGFRYLSFAWAGETLDDGYLSPRSCDGMGVVSDEGGVVTLVRNHELRGSSGPIGDPDESWDVTGGGTSTLKFDTGTERLLDSRISLSGTLNNCAGGVTPWGTWLSCEEAPVTPEMMFHGLELRQRRWRLEYAQKSHGYVFEVNPEGESVPLPIIPMGQFYHEATAIDPGSGVVYMTEDRAPYAGFYRYLPDVPGDLQAGGTLQMLKVAGHSKLIGAMALNNAMKISWVDIPDPGQGHTPGTHDGSGVVNQGLSAGASAFVSLEGCDYFDGSVYFTSKAGGSNRSGQIFRMDIEAATVELIFESTGVNGFSGLDNIVVSPQGQLIICEDRLGMFTRGQHIAGLAADGELFAICQANPDLVARYAGHDLHETAVSSEWAGACFSTDGKWMFANLYNPGITFAITGPWPG